MIGTNYIHVSTLKFFFYFKDFFYLKNRVVDENLVEEIYNLNKSLFVEEQKNKEVNNDFKLGAMSNFTLVVFYFNFIKLSIGVKISGFHNLYG